MRSKYDDESAQKNGMGYTFGGSPNIKPKARHRMVWEQVRQGRHRSAPLSLCTLMGCMPGPVHLFLGLGGLHASKKDALACACKV